MMQSPPDTETAALRRLDTDLVGRAGIIVFFGYGMVMLCVQLVAHMGAFLAHRELLTGLHVVADLAKLAFTALVVGLTVVRLKPVAAAEGWEPRFSAFAGTFMALLVVLFPIGYEPQLAQTMSGIGVVAVGAALSAYVLSFLGRSFSIMAEARKLVTSGPYGLVRHPLYLAELVIQLGIVILNFSLPVVLIMALSWAFQLRRMHHEEQVLRKAFADYGAYANAVPRVIPSSGSMARFFGKTAA